MIDSLPDTEEIRLRLKLMTKDEVLAMCAKRKVPSGTVMNIRHGSTKNAGLDTVRKFYKDLPELPKRKKSAMA